MSKVKLQKLQSQSSNAVTECCYQIQLQSAERPLFVCLLPNLKVHSMENLDAYHQKQHCALPRIEKKIMNPADIWTTLRLPTCVKASKPAFSLQTSKWTIREKLYPKLSMPVALDSRITLTLTLQFHQLSQKMHQVKYQCPTDDEIQF